MNKIYRLYTKCGMIAGYTPNYLTVLNIASKYPVGNKFEIGDLTIREEYCTGTYRDYSTKTLFLCGGITAQSMMGIAMNKIYQYIENKHA